MSRRKKNNQLEKPPLRATTVEAQKDQRRSGHISAEFKESRYLSQLPDPEDLAKLEELHSGTTGIILENFQEQAKHRRKLEEKVVSANTHVQTVGMYLGAGLILVAMGIGGLLINSGKDVSGLAMIITAIASPAIAFIGGKIIQASERKSKDENS